MMLAATQNLNAIDPLFHTAIFGIYPHRSRVIHTPDHRKNCTEDFVEDTQVKKYFPLKLTRTKPANSGY